MGAADGTGAGGRALDEPCGPYVLLDRIGVGGMAEAYRGVRGRKDSICQPVFIKQIRAEFRNDPDFIRWFRREASIVAGLSHPNIVSLVEADPQGRYLAFELVDGIDLRRLLRSIPDHRLSTELTVLIAIELCKAFVYAHSRMRGGELAGVVHRDVSPANVLISYAGEVKLADFGVAAVIRTCGEPQTSIKGKVPYMSPEQAYGEAIDGRSDLFSLGVLCYEILAGRRPFIGDSDDEIAAAIAAGEHPPLRELAPHVPPGLAKIIERLLEADISRRFSDAEECFYAFAEYAPTPTLCLELGRLARATSAATVRVDQPSAPAHPERVPTEQPSVASEPVVLPRRSLPYGLALAVSFLLLVVGVGAWIVSGRTGAVAQPRHEVLRKVASADRGMTPSQVTAKTAAETLTSRSEAMGRVEFDAPAPPLAVANDTAAPPTTGTLRVGALPMSQVWLDGQLVGWSPHELRVSAGRHTVGIGYERPKASRTIIIPANKVREVFFGAQ
jgi:serine/threonine protein kinase